MVVEKSQTTCFFFPMLVLLQHALEALDSCDKHNSSSVLCVQDVAAIGCWV